MAFDLQDRRHDPCRFNDGEQVLCTKVGEADGSTLAVLHQFLHRVPGFGESHAVIVKQVVVFIPGILIVSWLKRKWSVDEIKIQVIEPESVQTRLERWPNTLRPVIVVP